MSRLTKRGIKQEGMIWFVDHENNGISLEPCEMNPHHNRVTLEKLADYEDKEEQGLLISLPCKVGEEFWVIAYSDNRITHVRCSGFLAQEDVITKIKQAFVWLDSMENDRDYWRLSFDDFKKKCFLTRSEAEEALARMKGE